MDSVSPSPPYAAADMIGISDSDVEIAVTPESIPASVDDPHQHDMMHAAPRAHVSFSTPIAHSTDMSVSPAGFLQLPIASSMNSARVPALRIDQRAVPVSVQDVVTAPTVRPRTPRATPPLLTPRDKRNAPVLAVTNPLFSRAPSRFRHGQDDLAYFAEIPSVAEVFVTAKTGPRGLQLKEVERRRRMFGPNVLKVTERPSMLKRGLHHAANLVEGILVIAGIVAAAFSIWKTFTVVLGMAILNIVIGVWSDERAESLSDTVARGLPASISACRAGEKVSVPTAELVPGDVIMVQPGDRLPADVRWVQVDGLQVVESILTGEYHAVTKAVAASDSLLPLAQRTSVGYCGSHVLGGSGTAVVVQTGNNTEVARISRSAAQMHKQTGPLAKQLRWLGMRLGLLCLVLSALTYLVDVYVYNKSVQHAAKLAIAVAVAAIPEGLPLVITAVLRIGSSRLLRHNAIVHHFHDVETLGCVSTMCFDKTGTLTQHRLMASTLFVAGRDYSVSGEGYAPLGEIRRLCEAGATPCNDDAELQLLALCTASGASLGGASVFLPQQNSRRNVHTPAVAQAASLTRTSRTPVEGGVRWRPRGDPTDAAIITLGLKLQRKLRLSRATITHEELLQAAPKLSGTVCKRQGHNDVYLYLRGALEAILPRCCLQVSDTLGADQRLAFDALSSSTWIERHTRMADAGLRVIALAVLTVPLDAPQDTTRALLQRSCSFALCGLIGIADSLRPGVSVAMQQLQGAGIRVCVMSGDSTHSVQHVARHAGINSTAYLTGPELDVMDDVAIVNAATTRNVFSRCRPEDKQCIVEALQATGEVVAMVGDGVNDALAMRQSDLGIAVSGAETDITRDLAGVLLVATDFDNLAKAVRDARQTYTSLKKATIFVTASSFAQCIIVVLATFGRIREPFSDLQVLHLNIFVAVTLAVGLAVGRPDEDLLLRPPRSPYKPLLGATMTWRVLLAVMLLVVLCGNEYLVVEALGRSSDTAEAVSFTSFLFAQCALAYSLQALHEPTWSWKQLYNHRWLLCMIAFNVGVGAGLLWIPPLADLMELTALDGIDVALACWPAMALYATMEFNKRVEPLIAALLRQLMKRVHDTLPESAVLCLERIVCPRLMQSRGSTGDAAWAKDRQERVASLRMLESSPPTVEANAGEIPALHFASAARDLRVAAASRSGHAC